MRSLSALVGLASLTTVLGNRFLNPQDGNLQSKPGPNRTNQCPFFFSTSPSFYSGTGVTVNKTTGVVSAPLYGPTTDSVHYVLTFKKMNWGRNTWIQHRFVSNVLDLPIQNVKVCNMLFSYAPNDTRYEPEFEGRVKYSPRIKGSQPAFEIDNNVSLPWSNATASGQGFKTVCVTVPRVKPSKVTKVNFLYSSSVCSTVIVWKGWVEYDNPFYTLYPATAPTRCLANQVTSGPDKYNSVREYRTFNLKVPLSCGTCTPGNNCKGGKGGKGGSK